MFLTSENAEDVRKLTHTYGFGHNLQACFVTVPDFEMVTNTGQSIEQTPINGWQVLFVPGAINYLPLDSFIIPGMSKSNVGTMRRGGVYN